MHSVFLGEEEREREREREREKERKSRERDSSIKDDDDRWISFRFASLSSTSSSCIPFSFIISLFLLSSVGGQELQRHTLIQLVLLMHTHTQRIDKHHMKSETAHFPSQLSHDMALGIDQHFLSCCSCSFVHQRRICQAFLLFFLLFFFS